MMTTVATGPAMFGVEWYAPVSLLFNVLVTSLPQNHQLRAALRGMANKLTAYVGQSLSVHSRSAH
jgi:hypothetical protein